MGLAASQARLLLLTARRSNLESSGHHISERRMQIATEIQDLYNRKQQPQSCQSSGSSGGFLKKLIKGIVKLFSKPAMKSSGSHQAQPDYDSKIKALEAEDKKLEMQLKTVDLQHNAVQTEAEGVKKVIEKNIETGFKAFSGGQ